LPPITAALARTVPSWPHRYASWLTARPGPLHAGWWSLRPWQPSPAVWEHELAVDPAGYLDWCAGWQGVVPTRPLPAGEHGRVKAYRKLAREGTLPPLLVWWVSGLDGWLLLDGHARLVAAPVERERTRAWPLPGGVAAWEDAATAAPPGRQVDPG
jgi:hypothetical protein